MNRLLTLSTMSVLTSVSLAAQAFTISDGDARFGWGPKVTVGGFHPADGLRAADCSPSDNVHSWHWAYAVAGSGQGRPLNDRGHGGYSQQVSGNAATQTMTNVDGLGLFDAQAIDVVQQTGSGGSGTVEHTLTLTNTSAAQLDVAVYVFFDPDLHDTANFSLPSSGADRFIVGSTDRCGGCVELFAESPDHFFVGDFANTLGPNDMIAAGMDLPDSGLPFADRAAPADFTGAFQWTVSLEAGAQRTLMARTGHNDVFSGVAASAINSGVAVGNLTLNSTVPVLGSNSVTLSIGGVDPATANAVLFVGVDPAPTQIPVQGLSLMNPISGILGVISVPLVGGSGVIIADLTCAPTAAGASIVLQALAVDSNSPAMLPIVHSDLLTLVLGD